jgi:hypothetical protein
MALHTDLHSYQPLAVAPARPGHKDRSGSAHAKGDFVSVPIQQLHIGCLVTGQQRQQLGQDPPDRKQRRQPAGSAVQGSLLVSERLIKPDLFQELYVSWQFDSTLPGSFVTSDAACNVCNTCALAITCTLLHVLLLAAATQHAEAHIPHTMQL